jgi:hypothetical protein
MSDKTVVAAMIAAFAAVTASGVALYQGATVATIEAREKTWEVQLKRRDERHETYQKAIDLLTDYEWRHEDKNYEVVEAFTVPFVRAANRIRVHGSPASVAAMDEIQRSFAQLNHAKSESDQATAFDAIRLGLDQLVDAARADVGPKREDDLLDVSFSKGAGPKAW